MNILFFIVHPAKFHMVQPAVRRLLQEGNRCDIAIISKDVLPELLESSGLEYENVLAMDRRCRVRSRLVKSFAALWGAAVTVWRLWRYVRRRRCRYDMFVTDDCLCVLGWLLRVPSLFLLDDDIDVVPEIAPLAWCATGILAPSSTRLGRFSGKKIPYRGYKEACYLMPSHFQPDAEVLRRYGVGLHGYVFVRLVSLSATHDRDKRGISDESLGRLIGVIRSHGLRPLLCAERKVGERYGEYAFTGDPMDALQLLSQAAAYFGDSQTMTSEAVLLGVPAVRCNDFVGRISVMEEKETVYGMAYGFLSKDVGKAIDKLDELLSMPNLNETWQGKRARLLSSIEDVPDRLFCAIRNREFPIKNGNQRRM